MDEDAFQERASKLRKEIEERELSTPPQTEEINDDFDYNEKFYACPSCGDKIGFFSKAMNKWGKKKICPHCGAAFAVTTSFKFVAYFFIPAMLFHFLLLKPLIVSFGSSGSLSIGIMGALTVALSIRLKKVQSGIVPNKPIKQD
jgi:predicted RNA-binding Zn-ribbon protein involved in translation (DUF1610 family)